jgi:hypothetical protein
VYLHDLSLDPGDGSVAGSRPVDVDAATSVTLSEVADIDRFNLSEARERGAVILAWQQWYGKNKELFDQALASMGLSASEPPGLQSIAK